jgi:hypothetical protein
VPREIHLLLDDPEQPGRAIPAALLARTLASLQKALYQTGESLSGGERVRRRGRLPQQVTTACELRVSQISASDSIDARVRLPEPAQAALFEHELPLGEEAMDRLLTFGAAASRGQRDIVRKTIPDAWYRNRILSTLASLCPKPDDKARLRLSEGDGQGRCFTLDPAVNERITGLRIVREMDVRVVMGEIVELRVVGGLYFNVRRTEREVKCYYEADVEEAVVENIGRPVVVQGEAQLDEHGAIATIDVVTSVEPLDLAPLRLATLRLGDRSLTLAEPREIDARIEEDSLLAEIDELQLLSHGRSREELYESLTEDLFLLWDEYAQAPDDTLTDDAKALKHAVRKFLQEAE